MNRNIFLLKTFNMKLNSTMESYQSIFAVMLNDMDKANLYANNRFIFVINMQKYRQFKRF